MYIEYTNINIRVRINLLFFRHIYIYIDIYICICIVYIYIVYIYILYIYIYIVCIYICCVYIYIVYRERETTSTVYCPHSVTSRLPRLVLLWHFETAERQGISTLVTTSLPSGIFWQVLKMHGYFLERLFSWSYCLSPRNE